MLKEKKNTFQYGHGIIIKIFETYKKQIIKMLLKKKKKDFLKLKFFYFTDKHL